MSIICQHNFFDIYIATHFICSLLYFCHCYSACTSCKCKWHDLAPKQQVTPKTHLPSIQIIQLSKAVA